LTRSQYRFSLVITRPDKPQGRGLKESPSPVKVFAQSHNLKIFQPEDINSEESEIGKAQEDIPCQYNGPDQKLAMNYNFLIEPLREIEEENISIEFTETNKAVLSEVKIANE
jgi:methionyl-tRNA formyltransferase